MPIDVLKDLESSKQDVFDSVGKTDDPTDVLLNIEATRPSEPIDLAKEGHWHGWVKPALKDVGSGLLSVPETLFSLINGMSLWPVQKIAGTSRVLTGDTADEARDTEGQLGQAFGYQPQLKETQFWVDTIGKGFDFMLGPAKITGGAIEEAGFPRTGYLAELGLELATFKAIGTVKTKGTTQLKQSGMAKGLLDKKLSQLTKEERIYVDEAAKQAYTPVDIVKAEKKAKEMDFEKAYEHQKDIWIGEKDVAKLESNVEARLLQKEIKSNAKKTKDIPRLVDEAIQVYIDSERNPEHINKYYNKLTPEQKRVVDLSQNLPEYAKKIAGKVRNSYNNIGLEALNAEVIRNTIDNYAARKWDIDKSSWLESVRKFGQKTGHAKQRKFETIVEGWAQGRELKIKTATENLKTYKQEIAKSMWDKEFVSQLRKLKDVDGNPLLSTQHLEGYVPIEHPNMSIWEWAGKVENGKTYGKNFFSVEDGTLFERRQLYAPKKQAKNINNMLGTSKIMDVPGVKGISKFNATAKAWVLQTSLFHHMAFMRSFYLPGMKLEAVTPRQAYRQGIKDIETSDPVIINGVRNGLTLGLKQDWQESLLREKTTIGRLLDKRKATKATKDTINRFREVQADFLFGEFGAGLKAKTYELEFRRQVKKYPDTNHDVIAKRVAALVNEDFGGLHLQRLGRNPTLQHIFQLTALAPDWTESNIRTMVKTLKNKSGNKAELAMYRDFWGGVVVKGLAATALANYALAGGDINDFKDKYEEAWRSGNFNWMKVDITPIYEGIMGAIGQKPSGESKYFSVIGHFQDPIKFITHPVKSAKHKGSIVSGMALEGLTGSDWAGRNFTTFDDLISDGETVQWGNKKGPVNYEQFPSYVLSQLMGTQPIQAQNFMAWISGEMEGFDAMGKSIGLRISSTHGKKKKKLKGIK